MSEIVSFPSPMADERTPAAVEVIVAPVADIWIAWLRLPRGQFIALERTSDEWHALSDARAYAKRHNIPVTVRRDPLALKLNQPRPAKRGWISVRHDPSENGSWHVDHVSASGDSGGVVGSASNFEGAVTIARDAARRLGAYFDGGGRA